jgi:Rps23 Pro-64 3,4-dihydroxylase Tpa1-like proline 4-hydroxylase
MSKFIDLSKFDPHKLHSEFVAAEPFPHIVLDDFLQHEILDDVIEDFDNENFDNWDKRDHDKIQIKWRSNWQNDSDVPHNTLSLIQFLNSGQFLRWLSTVTGIQGIIPDPYLTGGGFNQINPGGTLAIHADGNWHDLMAVHRRLNIIIYLNDQWQDHWGGHFELWDHHSGRPNKCCKKVSPDFNRCVIFRTDDYSFHGHPTPLRCPPHRSRRSLILYYYSSTRPATEIFTQDHHRALFHAPEKLGIDYE